MEQLSLFNIMEENTPPKPLKESKPDIPLSELAFLYTATETGKNSDIHFMMNLHDAQEWCSSPLSHGVMMGARWAYFYTSVENFCNCHWGQLKGVTLDMRKCRDNGKYDGMIEQMGLKKYGKHEIRDMLKDYGIEVLI